MIDSPPRFPLCCFVHCCLMRQYPSHVCLYHCHDIPLALWPRPLTAIFFWPCGLAPSRRYSFGLAASPPHGDIPSALRPFPHGDILLALRPRPLTAIFLRLCGLAPSRRNGFSIHLTANVDLLFSRSLTAKSIFYLPHGECQLIFLTPPHGEINFLFASWRMSIFYSPHGKYRFYFSYAPSRQNRFSIRLTADVVFILFCLLAAIFHLRLKALINFLFGSRQEPISFRLHGDSRLTAVINVLLASRQDWVSFRFAPDGDINILSPHGDN